MEKLKTSEKIEKWLKNKLAKQPCDSNRENGGNIHTNIFDKYDALISKYKICITNDKAAKSKRNNTQGYKNGLGGKNTRTIDSKRLLPDTTKDNSNPYKVNKSFSTRKASVPIENLNSHINLQQYSNLPESQRAMSKKINKLSVENLKVLKSSRSKRKALYKQRSVQGSLHVAPATPTAQNICLCQKRDKFALPVAKISKGRNLYHSQNNPIQFKTQSVDFPRTKVNIWADEKKNKIVRYRKTEEMRGALERQKKEKLAREAQDQQNIKKEYEEMLGKIKIYKDDLKTEAIQKVHKMNQQKEIMEENKSLYQRNQKLQQEMDKKETMKENPQYLIERERQDKEFSEKRSKERKALDLHYLTQIKENQKRNIELKKLGQDTSQTTSFLSKLKSHQPKIPKSPFKPPKTYLPTQPTHSKPSENQISTLTKLQTFRALQRSRQTKAISLYNKTSLHSKPSQHQNLPALAGKASPTGLSWSEGKDVETVLRKGKLNREGIRYLKMSSVERREELDRVLKEMIGRKDRERRKKGVESGEFERTDQEIYFPKGFEMF
ncbi:unnamed protein product [Moneuplotes crassus]|uniref:Uncharacterized protein n=1 Tax=Euplotes crassus TaxID=5936 RepID=A0AAD1U602_EUPCR|nr:unnamed protein product [Moneuplotes crassus]